MSIQIIQNTILKKIVNDFIKSSKTQIDVPIYPINDYIEVLKQDYKMDTLDNNTNGYNVDFLYSFTNKKDNNKIYLSGDLWFGNYKLYKEK